MNDVVYQARTITYKPGCPHCPGGFAIARPLTKDTRTMRKDFWVVCDVHPVVEGHTLVIPRKHISCIGALDDVGLAAFKKTYDRVKQFIESVYGPVAIFEHGVAGQTVFHAHVHFLPFGGGIRDIVPEKDALRKITDLTDLQEEFSRKGKYLYVEVQGEKWLVSTKLAKPGVLRIRCADALGLSNLGNWKKARNKVALIREFHKHIDALSENWEVHCKRKTAQVKRSRPAKMKPHSGRMPLFLFS